MSQLKDNSTTSPTTMATAMATAMVNPSATPGISSLPNNAFSGITNTAIRSSSGSVSVSNGTVNRDTSIDQLNNRLNSIEERLAILTPDLVKLEKFEALKQAYDNYKLIETLYKDQP